MIPGSHAWQRTLAPVESPLSTAPAGERSPLGYSANTRQCAALGRGFSRALPALGLAAGQVVDMEADGPYVQVSGQVNRTDG